MSPFLLCLILQILDGATTVLGLRLGAGELNGVLRPLLAWSPVLGILAVKAAAVLVLLWVRGRKSSFLLPIVNLWMLTVVGSNALVLARLLWFR